MKRGILLVLIVLTIAGCNQTMYHRDNTTVQQFNVDKSQCAYEAKLATVPMEANSGGYYKNNGQAAAAGALQGLAIGLKQQELFRECMGARGYAVVAKQ